MERGLEGLQRVHEHPSYEGRCGAFVEGSDAFLADGLGETVEGSAKLVMTGSLEADFDGVETVDKSAFGAL